MGVCPTWPELTVWRDENIKIVDHEPNVCVTIRALLRSVWLVKPLQSCLPL